MADIGCGRMPLGALRKSMVMVAISLSLFTSDVLGEDRSDLKRCTTSCRDSVIEGVKVCFYDERTVCGKREPVCVDTKTVDCKPISVKLGEWAPRPTVKSNGVEN